MCRLLVLNKNSYDFLEDEIRMYVRFLGLPVEIKVANAYPVDTPFDILMTELPIYSPAVPEPDLYPEMKRVFLSDIPYDVPEEYYIWPRTMSVSLFYDLFSELAPETVALATHAQPSERWFSNYDHILERIVQVLDIIQNEYHNDLSLNYLANKVYCSPCYFSSQFTTYIGISPIAYVNEYRMKISANLLLTTQIKVTDICQMVSTRSFSYFCTCFKNKYNMTPTEFRDRYAVSHVS